jgi:hypothetical protein
MKTAGLVLDFYDDRRGEILKSVCPTEESLPGCVKTAHLLSPDERNVLRDEAYALIIDDGNQTLRKFACVDEGNTVLSTIYFRETSQRLPPEAVKTAAKNLIAFNEEFGLPVPLDLQIAAETGLPSYEKRASVEKAAPADSSNTGVNFDGREMPEPKKKTKAANGMARTRDSFVQPIVGDEADWAARTNLIGVRGGADSGRVIPTANQMKTAADKTAMLGSSGVPAPRHIPRALPTPAKKLTGKALAAANAQAEKAFFASAPKAKSAHVDPYVDVQHAEVSVVRKNKIASRTALDGRYSLDSFSDVETAVRYFEENWIGFDPADRHEFSVKTAARAEELGVPVPELMARYGSTEYAPDVDGHLVSRALADPDHKEVWDDLAEKRAMIEPEQFAQLLREADELFGLDHYWGGPVSDPYYATFGGAGSEKTAAAAWEDPTTGDRVTYEQIAAIPQEKIAANFAADFAEAFQTDPTTIFNSMPADTKSVLARMARGA